MNRSVNIGITLIFIIALIFFNAGIVYSVDTAQAGKTTAKKATKTSVKKSAKAVEKLPEKTEEKPAAEIETPSFKTNAGNMITIGGGYYMLMGEMSSYLKPVWSTKLTYQDNQRGGSPIGLGIDFIYAYPHDKDYNGGLMIITGAPHITLTIPFFSFIDLQFKAGPGITALTSILDSGKQVSGDMTLHCGGNISRVFAGAFYMGLGSDYYYIFERKNLRTFNSWFAMGYRW